MKSQIQNLKELALAHVVATIYEGFLPPLKDSKDILEYLIDEMAVKIDATGLESILSKYENLPIGDIEAKLFNVIDKL